MFEKNENHATQLFRPIAYSEENNLFICDDNTLGFSFLCPPISGWDTKVLASIGLLLKDNFPKNSMLSFSLWASPDIKKYLSASRYMRNDCKHESMRGIHDVSLGHLWGGTTNPIEIYQKTKAKDFNLIITFKTPVNSIEVTDEEVETVLKIKQSMTQYLNGAKLGQTEMTSEMMVNMFNSMLQWNSKAVWKKKNKIGVDTNLELNEQFMQTNQKITKLDDGVKLKCDGEETFCKILTAHKFPERTQVGTAYQWFADPFDGDGGVNQNFLITLNLFYPEQKAVKDIINNKTASYLKMTFSAIARFAPKVDVMRGELESLVKDFTKYKVVKASLTACVFAKDENEAENGITKMQSMMDSCGMTMIREESFAVPSFINLLPFGGCELAAKSSLRYFTMSTRQALPLAPLFGDWKGTGTPQMLMVSRSGQVMTIDLFDSKTNFNTLIYAESGSGKSFVTNEIIRSYLSTNDSVWAIDAGESYKKISNVFDGNFIEFTSDSDMSFNPFTMIDDKDPNAFDEALTMLSGLIVVMAFSNDKVTDLQYKVIEEIIGKVWAKKGRESKIDDIAEELKKDDDLRIKDVGRQLFSFTSKGHHGRYFTKPHNVQFKGDFNVLELDGLSNTPDLQSVVLYILIVQIQQEMYVEFKKDRNKKRIVLIDEAWQMLMTSPAVTEFLERGFRRFRKYNGCGIVITQSINDLQNSSAGKAIAANAANSLILKQKDSTIASAEKENLMSMPPAGYRLLKKVTTEKGQFSEIFFNCEGSGMGVGRFIVDPVRLLMYSTDPKDNAAIDKYLDKGMNVEQALINAAEERNLFRYGMGKPEFLDYSLNVIKSEMKNKSMYGFKSSDLKELDKLIEDGEKIDEEA